MPPTTQMITIASTLRCRSCYGSLRVQRFALSTYKSTIRDVNQLLPRISPHYVPNVSALSESEGSSDTSASLYNMVWEQPPRNIYIIKKPWKSHIREAMVSLINHLIQNYKDVNIIVESDVADEIENDLDAVLYTGSAASCQIKTDLLITLGGDGTILHATSLYSHGHVPPVLSFSLGTLGFLLPFDIAESKAAFHSVYTSEARVINRARLRCEAYHDRRMHAPKTDKQLISVTHAMNDISIHRGPDPHLTHLDIYANDQFVTRGISDGVVISTPTGSTAYSLSCGGSMVHPSVPCTLLTPICPRSLSFRPLIFPLSTKIEVRISDQSRGQNAELSIDGSRKGVMGPGDSILVGPEKAGHNTGIWCVVKNAGDWMSNLNNLLGFNALFGDKK